MTTLVAALEKFNRKERYWLLRNCVGNLKLDKCFIARLGKELNLRIPAGAWWAIDYHFDWLVGAIWCRSGSNGTTMENEKSLVIRNQQDIDFIIAFEDTMIPIEAKASTGWSNDQLKLKLGRLEAIRVFIEKLELKNITARLLLVSPRETRRQIPDDYPKLPTFLIGSGKKIPWLPLGLASSNFLKVTRCTEEEETNSKGDFWKLEPLSI